MEASNESNPIDLPFPCLAMDQKGDGKSAFSNCIPSCGRPKPPHSLRLSHSINPVCRVCSVSQPLAAAGIFFPIYRLPHKEASDRPYRRWNGWKWTNKEQVRGLEWKHESGGALIRDALLLPCSRRTEGKGRATLGVPGKARRRTRSFVRA